MLNEFSRYTLFKIRPRIVFWLLLLFIISRLFFVFFSPYAYLDEEGKQITLSMDILRGIRLPLSCYIQTPHSGGAFMDGFLAIPFVLIFGFNVLAAKMLALTFSLGIFFVGYRFFKEFYSIRHGVIFLILFIFSPPHFIQENTAVLGNIIEPILFIFLSIYLFFTICFKDAKEINYFYLGLVSGLGGWIQYGQFPVTITIVFSLLVFFRSKLTLKKMLCFLGGLILGILPLVLYRYYLLTSYDSTILAADYSLVNKLRSKEFFMVNIAPYITFKFFVLLFCDIPNSFHFTNFFVADTYFKYAYLGVFIFAFIGLLLGIGFWVLKKLFDADSKYRNLRLHFNDAVLLKQLFMPICFTISFVVFSFMVTDMQLYSCGTPIELLYPENFFLEHGQMSYQFKRYEVFFHPYMIFIMTIFLGNMLNKSYRSLKALAAILIAIVIVICSIGFSGLFPRVSLNVYTSEGGAYLAESIISEYVGPRYALFLGDMQRVYVYPVAHQHVVLEVIARYYCSELKRKYLEGKKEGGSENFEKEIRQLKEDLKPLSIMDRKFFTKVFIQYLEKEKLFNISTSLVEEIISGVV